MSKNQAKHYDAISNKYLEHYFDKESRYCKSKLYIHHILRHFNKHDYSAHYLVVYKKID